MTLIQREEITDLKERVAKLERLTSFLLQELKLNYRDDPARQLPSEVVELLRQGKLNEAAREYHRQNGGTLKDARKLLEQK